MKKDNRGFTLVELVLAMSMTSLVLLMVIFLLQQGGRYYQNSRRELEIQKEAQMAMSQLNQLIVNSDRLCKEPGLLRIQSLDDSGNIAEEIVVSLVDGQLLMSKKSGENVVYADRLMARWVTGFLVELPTEADRAVHLELTFDWNGKEYKTVKSIVPRNQSAK